jgi:hypothetical protein
VQVLILVGMVSVAALFGLRWRQYPLGIATGFGLYATITLLSTIKFSDFGTSFKFLWGLSSVVAYPLAVMIWIWFFGVPKRNIPLVPGGVWAPVRCPKPPICRNRHPHRLRAAGLPVANWLSHASIKRK